MVASAANSTQQGDPVIYPAAFPGVIARSARGPGRILLFQLPDPPSGGGQFRVLGAGRSRP
ncbi:hypothetical protein [Nocardia sp. NPDC051750]|uniref:hypothetical protein n=1 Tax=Nocardia sp. NPDC051750 TaxID=3364325 RepID=UPI0037B145E2